MILVGNGGHAKAVTGVLQLLGRDIEGYIDNGLGLYDLPSLGGDEAIYGLASSGEHEFFVCIGDNIIRERLTKTILNSGGKLANITAPGCVVSPEVFIGSGVLFMPNVVVNNSSRIGNGVILNTSSSVDHDCVVEDFAHVSVGARLCGNVTVGKGAMIGAAAVVLPNIRIGEGAIVGAGSVVVKDVLPRSVVVGVPAKAMKARQS